MILFIFTRIRTGNHNKGRVGRWRLLFASRIPSNRLDALNFRQLCGRSFALTPVPLTLIYTRNLNELSFLYGIREQLVQSGQHFYLPLLSHCNKTFESRLFTWCCVNAIQNGILSTDPADYALKCIKQRVVFRFESSCKIF